jgi:AAA+ ATPase superfamily predicted ATPase
MTELPEIAGIKIGKKGLYIGYLPGRKNPQLYFLEGGLLRTVAFFRKDEEAKEVRDFLVLLTGYEEGK